MTAAGQHLHFTFKQPEHRVLLTPTIATRRMAITMAGDYAHTLTPRIYRHKPRSVERAEISALDFSFASGSISEE
jgi:hypothetical protein